jgi:hypothetical protein
MMRDDNSRTDDFSARYASCQSLHGLLVQLTLIRDGKLVPSALRKEMLSEDELDGQLREQGVEKLSEVKLARLEGDGRLSVIKRTDA